MRGPDSTTLTKLRAQTERLLAEAVDRCPAGGRKLGCQKIGGYSARRVVHWVETGLYPSDPIKPWCGDALCVDCGRPGFEEPAQPAEPPSQSIAPPPPVPESHLRPVVAPVGPGTAGAGTVEAPSGGLDASHSSLVPVPVPERSTMPAWVRTAGIWAAGLVALFVVCVVSVQGLSVGVSQLRKSLPDVQVGTTSTTVVDGTTETTGG